MTTRKEIDKREDYCTGRPKCFLCVSGITDKFYECSYPYYEGWRPCSTGTECAVAGYHTSTPCRATRNGGGDENLEGSNESISGNSSLSSYPEDSSSLITDNKSRENFFEKLEWWHWLLAGVAIFLIVGIIVSLLIRLGIHIRRRRKRNDMELEEAKEKGKGMSPAATVLCMSPRHQQERSIREQEGEEEDGEEAEEEVRDRVGGSIISSSDSTSTPNSNTSSGGSNISPNRAERDLVNTL